MKTINDLNKKWWYRLVKVLYASLFVAIALLGSFVIYSNFSGKEVDYDKTTVVCPDGLSATLSEINKKIEQSGIGIPVEATGPFFQDEKASYFDLQMLANGTPSSAANPSIYEDLVPEKPFDAEYTTFCSNRVVVMKDGTQKLVPELKLNSLDLSTVSTIGGESLDYSDGSARIPIDAFATPVTNNYHVQIVTKSHARQLAIQVLIWLVMCVIVFEAFRRMFYYVILGKGFPAKQ